MSLLPRSLIFCAISLCSLAIGKEPYPVVDKDVQKSRDADRHTILEAELAAEQQALGIAMAAASKAKGGDIQGDVHRHEENVKALQREMQRPLVSAPVRVNARSAGSDAIVAATRTAPTPAQAPFWDVYRRGASPIDSQSSSKELP